MLKCKEFVKMQNEGLDGREFTIMEKMSMGMHRLMCIHCRRFLRQLKIVDAMAPELEQKTVDNAIIQSHLAHIQKHNQSEN